MFLNGAAKQISKTVFIGIDPGILTGFAVWLKPEKKFVTIKTVKIHRAFNIIIEMANEYVDSKNEFLVRVEDARQRKWFGKTPREKLQGAGAIKIQCTQWEEFLTDLKIDFEMVVPKAKTTKWSPEFFKQQTGWNQLTSNHARDAAVLVYGY